MASLILLVFAFVFFCLSGIFGWRAEPPVAGRWLNFIGIGLAAWVLAELFMKAPGLLSGH